jgi:hypothetical protein
MPREVNGYQITSVICPSRLSRIDRCTLRLLQILPFERAFRNAKFGCFWAGIGNLQPDSARALSDWFSRAEFAPVVVENKSQIGPTLRTGGASPSKASPPTRTR